jgi:hypothetical protein
LSWTGSILKDEEIENILRKAGTISSPDIGDGSPTQSQGEGELAAPTAIPQPDAKQEEEEKKKIQDVVTQQQPIQPMQQLKSAMPHNGWFQSIFGKDAESMVKELRMARRVRKDMRGDIDLAIDAIRIAKREEVETTLKSIPWADNHLSSIRALGVSDRNLHSLRKHGATREISLRRACSMWEKANDVITKLSQIEGDFNQDQLQLWLDSRQMRKDAKSQWKKTLHPIDDIKKQEAIWLTRSSNVLTERGPLSSNEIYNSIGSPKHLTIRKMASLLKMHGVEYDIEKIGTNYGIIRDNTVIVKDIWAYAAGFLDADGYITITKRGEPRAGFVATGGRGKLHCEQLYKSLGCGVLQTDLKVHKNSKRSQHRLQFYGADDLRKLLNGISPHLQMKKNQANAVLHLLDLRGAKSNLVKSRREELYRVVKWENWKDVPEEREKLLKEWKVEEHEVLAWGQRDNEVIRLVDDAHRIERLI